MKVRPLRCRARFFYKTHTALLLPVLVLLSSLRTLAQPSCEATVRTEAIRVENATGVDILRAAVNCSGEVRVYWAGRVRVGTPIVVAEGVSLSVTGDDVLAEVYGSGSHTIGTRLFEVSPGGSLTLTRLKLSGGSAGGGGAVYSHSANLTLDNCVCEGNVATDGSGGAVWANGGNVTVVGGEFLANNATRYGGAVHAVDGRLVVRGGSRFEGNSAIAGGAVYCGLEEQGGSTTEAVCSILDAKFVSNRACCDRQDSDKSLAYLSGGGAAMFLFASVDITGSVFRRNSALRSGGALIGGVHTNISVNRSTFDNNTSEDYGGAISASVMMLGGDTQLTNNKALKHGGAVLGWDAHGIIVFDDVVCKKNVATGNGGCFHGAGRGIINDGTAMLNNSASNGGSILAFEGSNISVSGGNFSGATSLRGGFIYAEDNTRVRITGGLVEDNCSEKRGGALYCNGNEASDISIAGGTFRNNEAQESGGAIAVWGAPSLVTITGGTFEGNRAWFYGGFAYAEDGARLKCDGATVRLNHAGDQGGGIYARQATWVNSTCDLIENYSPQGAAIYLTHVKSATFKDHNVTQNLASGGSVVYLARSSVVARDVLFEPQHSSNRAIQMDERTKLDAERCVFNGWLGDAVIFNTNSAAGSLVLDSCDFRGSSAALAVVSPHSDAEIRNAVVSDFTYQRATGTDSNPLALVDRALNCSDSNACGDVRCFESSLGVVCPCLEGGECLKDGGGELSFNLEGAPDEEIFYPDNVSYELVVSSARSGTSHAIWSLLVEVDDLVLEVVPSCGVLPPGSEVTVQVTGTLSRRDVGGTQTSRFVLMSLGNTTSGLTAVDRMVINSTYYMCQAHEYARPLRNDDGDDGISCEQCSTIEGSEGVNCTNPGATKDLLPIQPGYWRSSRESLKVHECLRSEACKGATEIRTGNDYCADGYTGPYCAVCTYGYGRGFNNACHSCNDANCPLVVAAGTIFFLVMLLLVSLAVVFLIGGLDAIDTVHQSLTRTFSEAGPKTDPRDAIGSPAFDFVLAKKTAKIGPRVNSLDETVVLRFCAESEVGRCGGAGVDGSRSVSSTTSDPLRSVYRTHVGPLGVADGAAIEPSNVASRNSPGKEDSRAPPGAQRLPMAGISLRGPQSSPEEDVNSTLAGTSKCCGIGKKTKHWISILPLNKLKILVVVWQILAIGSTITGVEFPDSYACFLSWISVVNLDIGNIFLASCLLPSINFYVRLLVTTLSPLVLAAVLVLTYRMAKRRAGIGRAGVIARRAAWSRHVAAGLLLTFLVFTSASTVVFKTFACNDEVVAGESYLREDYSILCDTRRHRLFKVYAGLMILVYPIGIPVLYAAILWKNRELLNPRIHTEPDVVDEAAAGADPFVTLSTTSKGQTKKNYSFEELQMLEEKVKARRTHPELVPSMFLWKDFGPDLYYYEVIECGRRMLLTGVLIFIAPQSPSQVAMACIFGFASLLGFEVMRPHMDPADSWLYRMGCVVIFLSNFLALLIKVDAAEVTDSAVFGGVLVAVNLLLVLAVLVTSWFAVQQSVDESRGEDSTLAVAKAMLTAEQYAAESARLTRSVRARMSSAFFSTKHDDPLPSDGAMIEDGQWTPHERHRSGITDIADSVDAMPGLTGVGGVNAASLEMLQNHS